MSLAKLLAAVTLMMSTPAFADAVVLHAPEPEASTLLFIGVAMIGASLRYRRRHS